MASLTRSFITLTLLATLLASCTSTSSKLAAPGQLHQVGFVWLKNAGDKADRRKVVDAVHEFAKRIPEVRLASVGYTDGVGGPFSDESYDVAFTLTFADDAARLRYNAHPVHEKAAKEVFLPLSSKLLFYRYASE
jgi:hypothetical protein